MAQAINILKAHGKSAKESYLLNGYALNAGRAAQGMPKRVAPARIACLDVNLQRTKMQMGVQVLVTDPRELEKIRQRWGQLITFAEAWVYLPYSAKLGPEVLYLKSSLLLNIALIYFPYQELMKSLAIQGLLPCMLSLCLLYWSLVSISWVQQRSWYYKGADWESFEGRSQCNPNHKGHWWHGT